MSVTESSGVTLKRLAPMQPSLMQHRVLIYLTCYNVLDGVTLTIRKLEQEILAEGHHLCILTTISGDPANTHLDGQHPNRQVIFMDNAIPIPFINDPERPELSYQLGFSLSSSVKRQLDDFEPTIVHITVPDCTTLHIIQYARNKELPIMATYHSNIPEYMEHYPGLSWLKHILGAFFRHQYNFVQALYVPTPFIMRHLIDNYKMDRVTSLKVWGRGVDVEKFNPAYRSLEYRRSLGIDDDATVVLWVGRLVPEKRPDIFANVVRRLHSRGLNFHALVVGAGPCEAEIKALPRTTFAGWLSAEQLSTAYASADVFLFPSAVETFGNVTLEAAASGLPLVVEAACSGHLVHDGVNGYTAQASDEDAFFEATCALVEDSQMREDYSANSREMALSLEKRTVVRQMLDNYNRVTNEFYTEYSGHHRNRDTVYTQPDSFASGKYPRPTILVCVEYLFIVIFKLVYQLMVVASLLQQFLRKRSRAPVDSSKKKETAPVPVPPPVSLSRIKKEQQDAIDSTSPNNLSVVELDDVDIESSKDLLIDDTTATTTSSSQQNSSSTQKSFGDCRLSHTLSKMFVDTVMFQCRMESHSRSCVSSCVSSTRRQLMGAPKRKTSSMEMLYAIGRNRSDTNDAEIDVLSLEEPQNMDGAKMRRQTSALE